MSLFLASTIKHPKVIKAMKEFVGGFEEKKMVYIPTAANSEEGFGVWKSGGTFNTMSSLCTNMKIIELEFVTDQQANEAIQETDIVFLAGGYPVYLSYWLHRRNLINTIRQRLEESMLLIGSSAGAMVCSKGVRASAFFENDPFTDIVPGMGLIDYEIWPHYQDKHQKIIAKHYSDVKIKPLRDGEYIIVDKAL